MALASGFLSTRYSRILTVALLAQAGLFYSTSRSENTPKVRPLAEFPVVLNDWRLYREGYVDADTQSVLKADDTLTRLYAAASSPEYVSLFIAFFKTQRTGQAPHSPKNCLPGSGWETSSSGTVSFEVPGEPAPLRINRYVVAKGDERSVVLYWYQTQHRVIASEYRARFFLVTDAIRYNRTDTALVRIVVPVRGGDEKQATEVGLDFVRKAFPSIRKQLPA